MSTALFTELSNYFNMDSEDPLLQKDLIRPAEIKEDFKLMEQRQRVTKIMKSKMFKKELENIVKLNNLDTEFDGTPTSTLSLAEISEQLLLAALPKNKLQNLSQLCKKKGNVCINDLHQGSSSPYGRSESQFRCKLAAVFRLIDMYGWNSGFNTTMTARPFRDYDQFLINPFGLMYHEMTASAFISIDFKGNILDFGSTVLEAHNSAWLVHAALYAFRSDIRTILHLKTPSAVAISSLSHGLLPICKEAIVLGDIVTLSRLASLEQQSTQSTSLILADIKNYVTNTITASTKVIMIPNQGFLICGSTIEQAWNLMSNCQTGCETQLKFGNSDLDDIVIPDKALQTEILNEWNASSTIEYSGADSSKDSIWRIEELEFEALMRHLDNNGNRTGYFYRQQNIYKLSDDEIHNNNTTSVNTATTGQSLKYDVEIPASSTYVMSKQNDEETGDTSLNQTHLKSGKSHTGDQRWFNTPNKYKQITPRGDGVSNILDSTMITGGGSSMETSHKAKWVSARDSSNSLTGTTTSRPQKPVTAGACVPFDDKVAMDPKYQVQPAVYISPREIIENQRKLKNKYYNDTNTAGPISCLLDSGLSREEALRMKTESLRKHMLQDKPNVVTSASKGIIQRGHAALVYQELYKPANPFENVTSADLEDYRREVDRKMYPHRYATSLDHGVENVGVTTDDEGVGKSGFAAAASGMQSEPEMLDRRNDYTQSGITSESDAPKSEKPFNCDPFFQTDFDENELYNLSCGCCEQGSSSKPLLIDGALSSGCVCQNKDRISKVKDETMSRSHSIKETSKSILKGLRSLSFKMIGRSKSVRDSGDLLVSHNGATKAATLAAPPHAGTLTSETSGAEVSHDEVDGKNKKKKRKFKFPFSKKKKDKSKSDH